MDSMFLTDEELTELTAKRQSAARIRALRGMGVEHKVRPDGSIAVLRAHVERLFGEKTSKPKMKTWQPAFH
ncbi:DUF4224 domain-containing protein [Paraburkholderia sp. BL17N1]|uniref:DUF4224 domain-containing protein n=1 Tax=Paraburkholderia sp. BL17N1 TaxID=1938798 RepID=UPI000F1019FC|nr:DUF4224 domain-containing protein [Paraburkholderia sp. BL17N1]RKR46257.1 uncharacterized protein DUF4224 [Paraburkholderia sp. BL17N1]